MIGLDPRIVSVVVVVAIAVYLALLPLRRTRLRSDDGMAIGTTVELEIVEPARTWRTRLPVPVLIGRAPRATLVVSDAQVSRLHARIDVEGEGPCIRDLGSRNGTWVNARPIGEAYPIRPGDEIELGATRIRFAGSASGISPRV